MESRALDYVVAPVKISTEGAVGRTLDLMINTLLNICGEVVLRIHHHLLRKDPDAPAAAQSIFANRPGAGAVPRMAEQNLPDVERVSVASNSDKPPAWPAKTPPSPRLPAPAAERYGLTKLAENIEDEPNNTTRFWCWAISRPPRPATTKPLVLSAQNKPGAVHRLFWPRCWPSMAYQ